jgi:hypothetical protein
MTFTECPYYCENLPGLSFPQQSIRSRTFYPPKQPTLPRPSNINIVLKTDDQQRNKTLKIVFPQKMETILKEETRFNDEGGEAVVSQFTSHPVIRFQCLPVCVTTYRNGNLSDRGRGTTAGHYVPS